MRAIGCRLLYTFDGLIKQIDSAFRILRNGLRALLGWKTSTIELCERQTCFGVTVCESAKIESTDFQRATVRFAVGDGAERNFSLNQQVSEFRLRLSRASVGRKSVVAPRPPPAAKRELLCPR